MSDVLLDPANTIAFPPIHEGRYDVDPEATGMHSPVPAAIRNAVTDAGVRLLRVGVGCWLPGQDPPPETLFEREWTERYTHVDRVLDVCRDLDVELLLSIDLMPASLARAGPPPVIPEAIAHAAPGYTFPDGVRCAPPTDPAEFAAATVELLGHVHQSGVPIRYVELWNEPDLPFFYSGTFDDYLATYRAFARAVAAAGYRVGGPSWSGLMAPEDWRDGFCRAVADEGLPLDFYSLHRYHRDPRVILDDCRAMRVTLDAHGLRGTELVLSEWGYDLRDAAHFGTVANAAFTAAVLMGLPGVGVTAQNHVLLVDPTDGPERLHGLTRRNGEPNPVWFALREFERFHRDGYARLATPDGVLAGVTGRNLRILLANPSLTPMRVTLHLADGPAECELTQLTQHSFDAGTAWEAQGNVTLTAQPVVVPLPPESLVRLCGERK